MRKPFIPEPEVMGCYPHCALEDVKEMYANARALFERPSTVATTLAQRMSPDVSSGRRSRFSKVSSSDLASASLPGYAPTSRSIITVSSDEDGSSRVFGGSIPPLFYSPAILPNYDSPSDD